MVVVEVVVSPRRSSRPHKSLWLGTRRSTGEIFEDGAPWVAVIVPPQPPPPPPDVCGRMCQRQAVASLGRIESPLRRRTPRQPRQPQMANATNHTRPCLQRPWHGKTAMTVQAAAMRCHQPSSSRRMRRRCCRAPSAQARRKERPVWTCVWSRRHQRRWTGRRCKTPTATCTTTTSPATRCSGSRRRSRTQTWVVPCSILRWCRCLCCQTWRLCPSRVPPVGTCPSIRTAARHTDRRSTAAARLVAARPSTAVDRPVAVAPRRPSTSGSEAVAVAPTTRPHTPSRARRLPHAPVAVVPVAALPPRLSVVSPRHAPARPAATMPRSETAA